MREKYRIERDKRVRPDGNEQYIEVTGDFSNYVDDPYVDAPVEREPSTRLVDVVVVGGGFGGLLAAGRLREAGIDDVMIIEKGGDFGGTWYWNRYPGAMCDVESYVYLPLLEEVGYLPTEKYVKAREILEHSRSIGRHYDLFERTLFQTEVTEARWDDDDHRWVIATDRGDAIRARFVAMANGPLHRPKLPGIEGINDYAGHTFHTSRWDYDYTGGNPDGGLTGLADKRVGIIGTGATAVQCVPHLGEHAEQLVVFQRTPSSVDVRDNRPTDPEWSAGLEPGWQRDRMQNFNALVSGQPQRVDLVDDGWTDIVGKLMTMIRSGSEVGDEQALGALIELADLEKMNEVRSRVEALVDDPDTAESLKPYYRQFCKRPCFHDEYLDTFNRPNVTLVDTDGRGIDRITERGIVANGVEHELDCIIFATGFEVGTAYSRRAGYEIIGRDDTTLTQHWADGVRTMHGMHVSGFPNNFILGAAQGGFTVNYPHMLDEVAQHVAHVVGHALDNDLDLVEVTEEAEQAWVDEIVATARNSAAFQETCTPGYYNNEGRPSQSAAQNGAYGRGAIAFFEILESWRTNGGFDGLDMR
ncbi:MAG: NAD(P)/FAD-dependent oxidoreductase [Ilumatobacter sp.]|uniref:flavin-containing monooxygenase n=1 Tax=Ilumatobacter sp. TaxID=1967498 RepID=UPI003296FDB8